MFLNGNQDHIAMEMPHLWPEKALQAVPHRLHNLKEDMAALSAGNTGTAGEAGVDTAYDEYARKMRSAVVKGVNACCGESTGEGSD